MRASGKEEFHRLFSSLEKTCPNLRSNTMPQKVSAQVQSQPIPTTPFRSQKQKKFTSIRLQATSTSVILVLIELLLEHRGKRNLWELSYQSQIKRVG